MSERIHPWPAVIRDAEYQSLTFFVKMKTRFVGVLSKASTGILNDDADTGGEPAATHSLKLTVVNSAWL